MTTSPTRPPALPPDAVALLARLDKAGVEHVLIGELAAALQGCPWSDPTVTIVPARYERNLDRLAAALSEVRAAPLREVGGEGWEPVPARLRRLERLSLSTMLGSLDVDFEPPATAGHLDLFENARRRTVTPGLEVQVAALEDLIRIAEIRSASGDEPLLSAMRHAARRSPLASA